MTVARLQVAVELGGAAQEMRDGLPQKRASACRVGCAAEYATSNGKETKHCNDMRRDDASFTCRIPAFLSPIGVSRLLVQQFHLHSHSQQATTFTCTMVPLKGAFILKNAHLVAPQDAQRQHTRSHACSSAKSVAPSACACLPAHMETSSSALATITGRPRGEDPNARDDST
ncbi:hypothetical protein HHK36_019595 [Tetracentron sinense]|uniref:Uncharacterized protein n=1 Tax=Tetracentron sinense TaxID=13715 RepID=A0A834YWH9_TETSI|nr:hypothetical protein HHK36_019595 [Tetracentron sinense]